jgi:hypothetical protein
MKGKLICASFKPVALSVARLPLADFENQKRPRWKQAGPRQAE